VPYLKATSVNNPNPNPNLNPDRDIPRGDECQPEAVQGLALVGRGGTSTAAAHVAGLAGIVRQYFRNGFYPTGKRNIGSEYKDPNGWPKWSVGDDFPPSAALVKAVLLNCANVLEGGLRRGPYSSSDHWSSLKNTNTNWEGDTGQSTVTGGGRPVLTRCLPILDPSLTGGMVPGGLYLDFIKMHVPKETSGVNAGQPLNGISDAEEPQLGTGEIRTFCVKILKSGRPQSISLVWTDPAAAVGAPDTLVNDLDLMIRGGGEVRYGNEDLAHTSEIGGTAASKPDRSNNFEMLEVASPQNGSYYQINVIGHRVVVHQGLQP